MPQLVKLVRDARISLVALTAFVTLTGSASAQTDAPAPDLRVVGWTIDDTAEGNGDGGLHPGESATLEVQVRNVGTRRATGVSITLDEAIEHPDVEILDKLAFLPDLPQNGQAVTDSPHLRIRVAATRPCGWTIPLEAELRADDGYFVTQRLTLTLTTRFEVDLDRGDERLFIDGDDVGDEFGQRIASGDIDADGIEDLVFGVPSADGQNGTLFNAGEVVIIYGTSEPRDRIDVENASVEKTVIYGEDESDRLGFAIAVGNFDGADGDDVAVGIPGADGEADGRSNAGEVHLYSGVSTRPATISSPALRVIGPETSFALGERVAMGDVNGDGLDDVVAGARPFNTPGEIHVVYGGTQGSILDLVGNPSEVTRIFESTDDGFGEFGLATGDMDGDGDDEVLVGRPFHDSGGSFYAILGRPGQLPGGNIDAYTPLFLTLEGESLLGEAVASGDFDGDGYADVAVSDSNDGVRVVHGGPQALGALVAGRPGETRVGTIRATTFDWDAGLGIGEDRGEDCLSAGDLDGDGHDELAVGSFRAQGRTGQNDTGRIAIVPGREERVFDIDLASARSDVGILYGFELANACHSHFVRNFDGTDRVDLVAGSKETSLGSAGSAALMLGRAPLRYRSVQDTYAFVDASVGTRLDLNCDDCGTTIDIGFPFEFFDDTHTEVTVSSNGYLTFGDDGGAPGGRCFPTQSTPNDAIAVFWDDLDPSAGGDVYALVEGEEPNRRLTVLWDGVPSYADGGTATFEVTLFETSGRILMQYDDVDFTGTSPSDFGGNAVVGVENATGRVATTYSCFEERLSEELAVAYRPFDNPTSIFVDDIEAGSDNWEFDVPWSRINEPACSPSSHTGESSFYFGYTNGCSFDDGSGTVQVGTLALDASVLLEQDSELYFWTRREASPSSSRDLTDVFTNDGAVLSVLDDSDTWRPSTELVSDDQVYGGSGGLDLAEFAGSNLVLSFTFDSVVEPNTQDTGWMIDDVEVRACPVHSTAGDGAGAASEALATAQPPDLCSSDQGRVDALGSYCSACDALNYQWRRDGAPIGGATTVSYTIPAGEPPGTSSYTVAISCGAFTVCDDVSAPVDVRVVQEPGEVTGLVVEKSADDSELRFTWNDVTGADDYVLRSDAAASGEFGTLEGVATSGFAGLTIPTPPDPARFYLVGGRNPTCGERLR
jgi:hypothetical protein